MLQRACDPIAVRVGFPCADRELNVDAIGQDRLWHSRAILDMVGIVIAQIWPMELD